MWSVPFTKCSIKYVTTVEPLLSGQFSRGWPLNRGPTVYQNQVPCICLPAAPINTTILCKLYHQAAPPLHPTPSFSTPSSHHQASAVKHPATAASSAGTSSIATADKVKTDSPKLAPKTYQVPENILSGMSQIREDLYNIEDQQMLLIDQLEVKYVHLVSLSIKICYVNTLLGVVSLIAYTPVEEKNKLEWTFLRGKKQANFSEQNS